MYTIRDLRSLMQMTQKEFAEKYEIPLSTLRKWEQCQAFPAPYIVKLIMKTIPALQEGIIKITDDEGNIYYLNKDLKQVSDSHGNTINFSESPDGVIESNFSVYIKTLFEDFYICQHRFNNDLKFDKIEKIVWKK